ncbi:MAG: toll/interleukin-1 receptor domain-containing protein [Bacilli bacterium]|nr:toll/interleukin-1 receptor domain-containing protein [Bacilli bacterium]
MNGFKNGYFDSYKRIQLNESRNHFTIHDSDKINVFVSHKHSDLEDLKGLIGFLETQYNCYCYVDANDNCMPKNTCGATATRLKDMIKKSDKFILLATQEAIESKWCNWELGYGDAVKFDKNCVALIFLNSTNSFEYGNEYMQNYPCIVYRDGTTKYSDGTLIPKGYYVRSKSANGWNLTGLKDWLNKK